MKTLCGIFYFDCSTIVPSISMTQVKEKSYTEGENILKSESIECYYEVLKQSLYHTKIM